MINYTMAYNVMGFVLYHSFVQKNVKIFQYNIIMWIFEIL